MENKTPSQIWSNDNPKHRVLLALQAKLAELAAIGIKIDGEERQQVMGSWPYEDRIRLRVFTIQSEYAYATAEWEDSHNDGSMEDWTSLTVKLYGDDPLLQTIFNNFFTHHTQSSK